MKRMILSTEELTEEEMQAELDAHFAELNKKIENFQKGRAKRLTKFEDGNYTYIERQSLEAMINNYIRWFNINVKEEGDGFASDWDDDDWLYILYKDGKIREINPQEDDGTKRIKVDGIDSMIVNGSWGSAYAGPHVRIYNMREEVDYGKYGYKDIEQRYKDDDDLRLEFTV